MKLRGREGGSAFLLLLIATSMIAMMCIGLIDILTVHAKTRGLTSASVKRDALLTQLRREGRVGLNLYASIQPSQLTYNDQLKRHIVYETGDTKWTCKDARDFPTAIHPMRLVSDSGDLLAGTGGSDFAYYDEDGKICEPGGKPCVMQVSADFTCYCNDGMNGWDAGRRVCNVAKGIDMRFTVEPKVGSGYQVSKRTASQYVPVQDWGFGQWSLITFNSEITVAATPDPNASPTPQPNPQGGGGPGPAPNPTPVAPTPLPPPAPMTASCPAGETPINGVCVGVSL